MKEIIMKVEGMVCNGCERRVINALQTIDGVKNVVADHIKGIVTINSEENVTADVIKEKILDIGFEVKED